MWLLLAPCRVNTSLVAHATVAATLVSRCLQMLVGQFVADQCLSQVFIERLYDKIGVHVNMYDRRGKVIVYVTTSRYRRLTNSVEPGEQAPPQVEHVEPINLRERPRPLKRTFAMIGMY